MFTHQTFLAHQAWDSLSQATLANCWLKSDILPLLHKNPASSELWKIAIITSLQMDEIEMALEEQTPTSKVEVALDEEEQHSHPVVIESNTDLDDDINEAALDEEEQHSHPVVTESNRS